MELGYELSALCECWYSTGKVKREGGRGQRLVEAEGGGLQGSVWR